MRHLKYRVCGVLLLGLVTWGAINSRAASHQTQNVFLIISDGLRWQEVFNGAEAELMNATNGGVKNPEALRAEFLKDTSEARRQALFPFLWNTIAHQGQIFGNQTRGSLVSVSNGKKFSYPGYNEILSGWGDPRIDSNDKKPNPNETVFEWLNNQAGFQGRVSILGTWDVFPYIFNIERSRIPIWPAWEPRFEANQIKVSDTVGSLLRDTTPLWEDLAYDSLLLHAAQDHIKRQQPRVVFIGFGETDEWAHEGRYDHYLHVAHRMDDFVRRLWETAQGMSQYRNKTTLILTADHGRGSGPTAWRNHGEKVEGAEGDWIAIIGPDTPPLGERTNTAPISENQIAATIATLLGKDFRPDHPHSGLVIQDAFGKSR